MLRRIFGFLPWIMVAGMALMLSGRLNLPWLSRLSSSPVATVLQTMEEKNDLLVFAASFSSITQVNSNGVFGLMASQQVGIMSGTVDYLVPLGKFDAKRLDWNAASNTLAVHLPAVQGGPVRLNTKQGRYFRSGIWVSADMQDDMTRQNSAQAEKDIKQQAQNPYYLKLARAAAKNAMQSNLKAALIASGHPDAKISIFIDGE